MSEFVAEVSVKLTNNEKMLVGCGADAIIFARDHPTMLRLQGRGIYFWYDGVWNLTDMGRQVGAALRREFGSSADAGEGVGSR